MMRVHGVVRVVRTRSPHNYKALANVRDERADMNA